MTAAEPLEDHLPEDETPPQALDATEQAAAALKIAELEKKLAETHDKMLRALAEAQNTRQRAEKERQDTAKFAVSSFARALLPVADNLRRAIQSVPAEQREKAPELKGVLTGVEATERELLRALEANGIRKIEPLGQKFDPNLHEVMFEADSADKAPGTVVQVMEPGYTIHDRLLRPARVGVAKGDGDQPHVDEQV
jgi:molecular chaperone GrpE